MSDSSLSVHELSKHFGRVRALDSVSFELGPVELLALVGPSGCGKSTLLRTLGGLHAADRGRIELAGVVVDDGRRSVAPEHRRVGLVFQDHALFPHLTVAKNIGFGVRDPAERTPRIIEMLDLVGLTGYEQRYPHELSGGERQRVALARAMAPRPSLMLLDEPFASLDPNLRSRIRDDVVHILRSTGTPAVFVTHDQGEAMAIGDRVAVMRAGRIVQVGTPQQIFHEPASRFVASFMGEADFVQIAEAPWLTGDSWPNIDERAHVMVRPDDITFRHVDSDDRGAPPATIVAAEFRGSTWCYTLRLTSGSTIRALRSHLDPVAIGTPVQPVLEADHRPVVIPIDDTEGAAHSARTAPPTNGAT
jgi:iron(III) transport system ATP-binding protein